MTFQKVSKLLGNLLTLHQIGQRRLPTAAGAKTISAPASCIRRIVFGEFANARTRATLTATVMSSRRTAKAQAPIQTNAHHQDDPRNDLGHVTQEWQRFGDGGRA